METRIAPGALAVVIGVVSGVAAAVSLTAESSLINIVGVMVAAALIPAAAATGLALAFGYPVLALGTAALVVATVVAIDLTILGTLFVLGYRPSSELLALPSGRSAWRTALVVLLLGSVLVATAVATVGQVSYERDVNRAVDDVVSEREDVSTVAVRSEYVDYSPFTTPDVVIVEVTRSGDTDRRGFADRIAAGIEDATGLDVDLTVVFVDVRRS